MERRTSLKRTKGPARTGGPKARPKSPMSPQERLAAREWWARVARGQACVVCRGTRNVQGHHVVPKHAVKKKGGEVWDARNGMAACEECHARHTNAFRRIPRYLVSSAAWSFAEELNLTHIIEREYPAE